MTWDAHARQHVRQLQNGLLALIADGTTDHQRVVLRRPTEQEIIEQRRGNDTDADYATPASPRSRTPTVAADPTADQTERWTYKVGDALLHLQKLVDQWGTETDRLAAARPHRFPGIRPAPTPGPLTTTSSGRTVPVVPPSQYRPAVLRRTIWLNSAIGWLRDLHTATEDQLRRDHLHSIAQGLTWELAGATRQHHTDTRHGPTRCANPHGLHNHPTPRGQPVCPSCAAPTCNDPLERGCTRRVSPTDHAANRPACAACRKAKSRAPA